MIRGFRNTKLLIIFHIPHRDPGVLPGLYVVLVVRVWAVLAHLVERLTQPGRRLPPRLPAGVGTWAMLGSQVVA